MLYNSKTNSLYCNGCKKWYKIHKNTEVLNLDGMLVCDKYNFNLPHQPEHILGYEWDKEVKQVFLNEHIKDLNGKSID